MIPDSYAITDEGIESKWWGCWGDDPDKRAIIAEALLQISAGFVTGHTITFICRDLKLLTPKSTRNEPRMTKLGKRLMYFWVREYLIRQKRSGK